MNVLWKKRKFHKIFSTENVNNASGDAASAGRCCRLCGGDTNLRSVRDTYVWEGVEERYDQLLYDCFAVRVASSDCLICEWCVRQLRNTEKFKALVHAAFDKPPSSSIPSQCDTSQVHEEARKLTTTPRDENFGIIDNKGIIELLKTKMSNEKRKRKRTEKKPLEVKRTNVYCKVCKQKYIMIMSSEACTEFVCSRCKKNDKMIFCRKCKTSGPTNMMREHMGFHIKADLRGKCRPSLSKKPSPTKWQENIPRNRIAKFKCSVCPKKYTNSEHLVDHMKLVHGERRNKNTVCVLCGKNFRTKETLDKHMQMHLDEKTFIDSLGDSSTPKHASKMYGYAREKGSV